jgi:hypothetical protein
MRTRSVVKHAAQASLEGGLVALLVVGLLAGTAFAGKGAGGGKPGGGGVVGGGSLDYRMVTDSNGDGALSYGDVITFVVTSSATSPMVQLMCYQGGDWVTNQSVGFYPGWPWSQDFPLSSWKWTGGAADCTASLYYTNAKGAKVTQATKSFTVAG